MYNKFIESDEWMAQTTSLSDRFGLRFHLSRPLAIRESHKSNGEFRVCSLFRNGNGWFWSGCDFFGYLFDINGSRQMRMWAPLAPFRIGIWAGRFSDFGIASLPPTYFIISTQLLLYLFSRHQLHLQFFYPSRFKDLLFILFSPV
jgi:hypothetical protein